MAVVIEVLSKNKIRIKADSKEELTAVEHLLKAVLSTDKIVMKDGEYFAELCNLDRVLANKVLSELNNVTSKEIVVEVDE